MENGTSPVSTPGEDGISFREAGLKLGISEKTLRRRIEAGEIRAWRVQGRRGEEWRVSLPGDRDAEPADRHESRACDAEAREGEREDREEDRAPMVALYRELLQRHEGAVARLGYLEATQEQTKALAAQAESLIEAKARAETEAEALRERVAELEAAAARRRWWRPWG